MNHWFKNLVLTLAMAALLSACGGGGGSSSGGSDATTGMPSVVTKVYSAVSTSICPSGGIQVDSGIDDNGSGALDAAEVDNSQYVCNGQTGTIGPSGSNGFNTLVEVVSEPVGSNCQYGGLKIKSGLDLDRDNILNTSEISMSYYVCNGAPGVSGGNVGIDTFHGAGALKAIAEAGGKSYAIATITSATASLNGLVTVTFMVKDDNNIPVSNLASVRATIAKLVPASGGESFNKWVPYIYRTQTVSDSSFPNPPGTVAEQGFSESNGTLTNHGDGSYTYVFATNIASVVTPVTSTAISYDRSLVHRVSIMMGGSSGATADAVFDFVPDGSSLTATRNIVPTSVCKQCHGEDFSSHADCLSVKNCVTCHVSGSIDPQGGESLDFKVMIHKIHAGGDLPSVPGADRILWDDPSTVWDESADNGMYAIWGAANVKKTWWTTKFPAKLQNCIMCHQGPGTDVDNWKTIPSRAACGSCHDDVDFGSNHSGGTQSDDSNCAVCHPSSGSSAGQSVTDAHKWTEKDLRNIPEFAIELTVSTPPNGSFFVAGETPIVTVVLKKDGVPIDHRITHDSAPDDCFSTNCPPSPDGRFTTANLFVHGPRARRNPVLTTKARAKYTSQSAGPFDISAPGATLDLAVDNGEDLYVVDASGADKVLSGTLSIPVSSGTWAGGAAAATPSEIVSWLNSNTTFKARCIAYLEPSGRVSIRSRNLGKVFAIQGMTSAVNAAVFGGDVTVHMIGGTTVANPIDQQLNPAMNDPKVTWSSENITYTLDPVDDLKPGTYVVSVEFSDRGRLSSTNYKTPSVAKTTFQVGMPTEEKAPAGNCDLCHQGPDGKGFVSDPSQHNKIIDATAVDQCGACHDYQPQLAAGEWSGAGNIAKLVHAVHFGASLNYPNTTIGYVDNVSGRNWAISNSQDVRNCESCHPEGTTSGSWKTKSSRLSCGGCHDSQAATAHMKLQTYDLTPTNPWNGDETESCPLCH